MNAYIQLVAVPKYHEKYGFESHSTVSMMLPCGEAKVFIQNMKYFIINVMMRISQK